MNQDYAAEVKDIYEALKRCSIERLGEYELDGEPAEHRIAYSIVEMADAAERILDLKARLSKVVSKEEGEILLSDLADELEHLIYHIKDSGLFSSVLEDEPE
ncbi:MAG: hypothetical protein QM661_09830 [Solimonas sp.]